MTSQMRWLTVFIAVLTLITTAAAMRLEFK
jgi:hypothetical protein